LGGLATSVSRMSFKNSVGCYLRGISGDLLFSENLSFVVEVSKEKSGLFQETLKEKKTPFSFVGETNNTNKVVFDNHIDVNISLAKDIWVNSLRERLQS
jgi:phosphoribosylformylglycinamidine (FGAM) synthase-like enzyme